jgi:sugar/nucleoside kinase (ribokinase family)
MRSGNRTKQDSSPAALLVVGELNVDLILSQVNALPELDREYIAKGMTLTLGSSSAILASNASAMGLPVTFVGRIGIDAFGSYVIERLKARGIDTRYVLATPNEATGLTAIYTYGNRRGALTYPGAMSLLTIDDVPAEALDRAQHLHVSSYYLQSALKPDCAALFRRAREAGLTTSFDTNWDPDERWDGDVLEVLDHVDIFLPNEDEACLIAGEQDLDRALSILASHARTIVATCGADGVRVRHGDQTMNIPAIPVEPVDAVGAGDSFNAGFLLGFIAGRPLEDCLRLGLLSGAFSTTAAGGVSAFDDMERLADFSERNGISLPRIPT